jgi:glutathione S-transferase
MDRTSPILYELSGRDDRRFSPFCWKTRMALAHKGFFPEGIPVGFTEKSLIAFSGQERVPILIDQGTIVTESWTIACHLEDSYPDRPTLFGGSMGRNLASFIDAWATRSVFPLLVRLVLCDVVDHLEGADADYVRTSREKQMGLTFAAMRQERDRWLDPFRQSLAPARSHLKRQLFISGEAPGYADYCLFGFFQWARMISSYPVIESSDTVGVWRSRVLELFDGFASKAPASSN